MESEITLPLPAAITAFALRISHKKYKQALENYEKSLAMRLAVYGNVDHPDIAKSYRSIGIVQKSEGRYGEALDNLNKCLDMERAVHGLERPP